MSAFRPLTMAKRKKKRRWPRVILWLFVGIPVVVVVVAVLFNYVVMPLVTQHRRDVEVPDLVGMAEAKAVAAIADLGFKLGQTRTVSDSELPAGHIVAQYPGPGRRVKPGRVIQLDVSRGTERVMVPDLVGMSLSMAQSRLEEAGLALGEVESLRTPNLPIGQVIATRPSDRTEVELGSRVTVAVAASVGRFPMPSLIGMNLETASGIIASQGLVLGEVKYAPGDEPVGIVLVQYPEEGMPVRDGDSTQLIVSSPASDSGPAKLPQR